MIRNQPDKSGVGRRPLLLAGNNRQMLNEIRDNLSHLRKDEANLSINDPANAQLKQDLSQSTPNLLDKSSATKGIRRDSQHHKTLVEIRKSLRPYQTQTDGSPLPSSRGNGNSSATMGGNGVASDASSTASSSTSSSHVISDQDVSPAMVNEIVKRGFDTEIAVHALQLSGNQSVDAALRLLQYMMDKIKEGNYPMGPPPPSVLPTYHQRPSFGPRSPSASESNSIRSDSPGLSHTLQTPPVAPTSHASRQLLSNGLQTPPPIPPRAPITAPPYTAPSSVSINSSASSSVVPSASSLVPGMVDGVARMSISSSASNGLLAQQQPITNHSSGLALGAGHSGTKGKIIGGVTPSQPGLHPQSHNNAVIDPSEIPQGHVKQLIQSYHPSLHQHKQQPLQVNGGSNVSYITGHQRGVSPIPNINCQPHPQVQPMMMGTSSSSSASNTPAPSPLLQQQLQMQNMVLTVQQGAGSNSSSSPSPAPSSSGSSSVHHSFPQGPPPPYSQAQAQIQAARLGIVLPTGVSLASVHSEHSNMSASATESQKKLVANKAVSATCMPMDSSHLPVIMKSVKSKEVQKPMPQTATIPNIPPNPTSNNGVNGLQTSNTNPGFASPVLAQQQHNHHNPYHQQQNINNHLPSQFHHLSNKQSVPPPPSLQPHSVPVSTFPVSHSSRAVVMTERREVNVNNIHITHSQPHYPHLLRSTAGLDGSNNLNLTPEQLVALATSSTGQPTILSARAQQNLFSPNQLINMNNIHIKNADQCNNNSNNLNSNGNNINVKTNMNVYTDPTISTPRSDSPVSRVTNQSPLSVLSTTSSPSTNSDIPERLPPPYPGRLIGHHPNPPPPPLLPPRIPLNPTTHSPDAIADQFCLSQSTTPSTTSLPKYQPPSHLPSKFNQDRSSSSSSPSPSSPVHITGALPPYPSSLPQPSASTITNSMYAQQPLPPLSSAYPLPQQMDPVNSKTPNSVLSSETEETDTDTSIVSQAPSPAPGKTSSNQEKHRCMSPLPERNIEAKERDQLRSDTKVKMYSPQAFKFYMEQHVENVLKSHSQRVNRKLQLEKEMAKANLSDEAACQMRKMLHQKESNYIRLKRAKMDSSMFEKIKTLGVGAFGEVALVRKKDVGNFYAMKTLQKSNVIKRNQVAHVKAERDILAEADNEWVVKLYYSFQDQDNLYFVMDYVPGGDLMGLLIRMEILPENLARFYIAELVLAIESVHRMGFIHRDIKPDNILIDQEGHIKLTDFGLCTGFRWTHNSRYYQKDGAHARQDSMEVSHCLLDDQCRCEILKPLEQRRAREQKRCLAHSLVGTPNYIAPEVLLRQGYTKACDWWSVGVILYEMVIGSPPFYASTPAETQYKVINWKETLCIRHDSNISKATSNLIKQLLQGAESRLGKDGAGQVKDHLFFEGINFEGLRRQPAPYKPTIRSMTDTSNFDPVDPEKLPTSNSDCSKRVDSKHENGKLPEHAFYEFTFRRFFDDGGPPVYV